MKQTNISVFIPHVGCKNNCSFCNQRLISGANEPVKISELEQLLKEQANILKTKSMVAEIAFFGGSFTAIDRDYMAALLKTANRFIKEFPDIYNGIRCSTRPDCIDEEILKILKFYNMKTIELGAQSICDEVLKANNRGHSAVDVETASRKIKEYGFNLGLQMMTGLYLDTPQKSRKTAEKFTEIKPSCVRIYPTVILKGTYLAELFKSGIYKSFSFEETVKLCADLLELFEKNNIPVIRLGLHASEDVEKDMLGGVYHPALREICESEIYYKKILKFSEENNQKKLVILSDKKYYSKISGHGGMNKKRLLEKEISIKIKEKENQTPQIFSQKGMI